MVWEDRIDEEHAAEEDDDEHGTPKIIAKSLKEQFTMFVLARKIDV